MDMKFQENSKKRQLGSNICNRQNRLQNKSHKKGWKKSLHNTFLKRFYSFSYSISLDWGI